MWRWLHSLQAPLVGKWHVAAYGADAALAGSCEAKHKIDPSVNTWIESTPYNRSIE